MDNDIIELIEKLDAQLRAGSLDPIEGFRRLGHQKSLAGLARAGLEDSLRAYAAATAEAALPVEALQAKGSEELWRLVAPADFPSEKAGFAVLVQLGEAFRIHARDLDISSVRGALHKTLRTIHLSVKCFEKALELSSKPAEAQLAWAYAHCGAAYTTLFWIEKALAAKNTVPKDPFSTARKCFESAIRLDSKYVWALQFDAFLLTIHGTPADFDNAKTLLHKAKAAGATNTPVMDRSLAILNFNLMGAEPAAKRARLRASAAHGLAAMRADTEECPAAFFVSASMAVLAKTEHATKHVYEQTVASAIQSARTRATNIISQAAASLVGLAALETYLSGSCQVNERQPYREWLDLAKKIQPDLETRVVFDHAMRQVLALLPEGSPLRDELKEFLDAFRKE